MAMPTDDRIVKELNKLLKGVDWDTTTERMVRHQLEAKLGVGLSDKKQMISKQIDKYMNANRISDGDEEAAAGSEQLAAVHRAHQEKEKQEAAGHDGSQEEQEGSDNDASQDEQENSGHRRSMFDQDAPSRSPSPGEPPSRRGGRKAPEAKKRKAADSGDEPVKEKKVRKQAHCLLSPELQAFLGVETLPRFQVVKELWVYIKANNLQDPKNKRSIICDDKMKTIFKPPIDMFSMNKQLSSHIKNANQTT